MHIIYMEESCDVSLLNINIWYHLMSSSGSCKVLDMATCKGATFREREQRCKQEHLRGMSKSIPANSCVS